MVSTRTRRDNSLGCALGSVMECNFVYCEMFAPNRSVGGKGRGVSLHCRHGTCESSCESRLLFRNVKDAYSSMQWTVAFLSSSTEFALPFSPYSRASLQFSESQGSIPPVHCLLWRGWTCSGSQKWQSRTGYNSKTA